MLTTQCVKLNLLSAVNELVRMGQSSTPPPPQQPTTHTHQHCRILCWDVQDGPYTQPSTKLEITLSLPINQIWTPTQELHFLAAITFLINEITLTEIIMSGIC